MEAPVRLTRDLFCRDRAVCSETKSTLGSAKFCWPCPRTQSETQREAAFGFPLLRECTWHDYCPDGASLISSLLLLTLYIFVSLWLFLLNALFCAFYISLCSGFCQEALIYAGYSVIAYFTVKVTNTITVLRTEVNSHRIQCSLTGCSIITALPSL